MTAELRGETLDATQLADDRWVGIYRQTPAVVLRCRGCEGGLGARVSKNGLRHFFHRRENPDCPSAGETEEHRRLKQLVADTVRGLGGVATIEAMPGPTDIGGWRADVLAEREGRRIAFEIQHSPMQVDIGKCRSERYSRDRIAVCWVTAHDANWIWRVPSARLRASEGEWLVTRGTVMTRLEPRGAGSAGNPPRRSPSTCLSSDSSMIKPRSSSTMA